MAKIAVDAYLNLAELFNDNFNAVLLLAGDGMPGSEMVMTMQGDHDQNTRNWVAFLLKNPDYISIVFRAILTVFESPDIVIKDKRPLLDAFENEMQEVVVLMEMVINRNNLQP